MTLLCLPETYIPVLLRYVRLDHTYIHTVHTSSFLGMYVSPDIHTYIHTIHTSNFLGMYVSPDIHTYILGMYDSQAYIPTDNFLGMYVSRKHTYMAIMF